MVQRHLNVVDSAHMRRHHLRLPTRLLAAVHASLEASSEAQLGNLSCRLFNSETLV